ncbi:MAG: porin family protein [Alphaproteobacteria bacterium]|nr:MAG: porin family protein [Alphaproteobacteria bacterium]
MKKHLITTTAAGAVLAMTAPVHASGYVKLFGGINELSDNKLHFEEHNQYPSCAYIPWAGYCIVVGGHTTFSFTPTGTTQLTVPATGSYSASATMVSLTNSGSVLNLPHYNIFGWTDTYNATDVEFSTDNGYVIGAAAGKDLGGGLSIEGEIAYRKNDVDAKATYFWKHQGKLYHYTYTWGLTVSKSTTNPTGTYTVTPTSSAAVSTMDTMYNPAGTGYIYFGTPTVTSSSLRSVTYHTFNSSGPFTKVDSGDLTAFSIMANVWYEFCPDQTFHPYIGGGVGFAEVSLDVGPIDESYNGFAWQAAAGVAFDVSENMSLSVEARFFEVPDAEFDINGQTRPFSYESQEILVGLKFKF